MRDLVRNYLGLNWPAKTSERSTSRALPSSWYRSDSLYELERRAIFSRKWLLITHKHRFTAAGDWFRFEEAGFQFFLVRDREGNINGFHNVCRHRAFPVVMAEKGTSQIFSCKYHGWSYGLSGKLAKAPGYQDMEGFDKGSNNLFPVHVHIDHKGFVWVNLDSAKEPEIQWTDDFDGIDTQKRFESFEFEQYKFDHTWGMGGDYNWKTLADNYNECYHCPTAHPDVKDLADIKVYAVETNAGHITHYANPSPEQEKRGAKIASTFYFPNACMTVSPAFFYLMRCVPTSARQVSMEYEVYRHKDASDEDFEKIDSMFKRILSEDKWLCNNAQKNLNAGVFVNGEMHPRMEKGSLFFQATVRELLLEHRKREESQRQEIWPARQTLPQGAGGSREDIAFCSSLNCDSKEELGW